MFGLSRTEVERILENANKEQARLLQRLEAAQAELTRAQREFDTRVATETQLRAQLESIRGESDGSLEALETEVQQLRQALASREAEGGQGYAEFEARIQQLNQELFNAHERLNEVPALYAEIESLRGQIAERDSRPYVDEGEFYRLREENDRLRQETGIMPELQEQLAVLQTKVAQGEDQTQLHQAYQELDRLRGELANLQHLQGEVDRLRGELASFGQVQNEVERLRAEAGNVPNLLSEIEHLRHQLNNSVSQEEVKGLRAEIERLQSNPPSEYGATIDLDRTLLEARRILDDARAEADRERELIVEAAHHHAEEIIRRAQRQFSAEAWEIEKIRLERRRYLSMFRSLLNRHLHDVEELEAESQPTSEDVTQPRYATVEAENGTPPAGIAAGFEGGETYRSPFSYPQADEPFHS